TTSLTIVEDLAVFQPSPEAPVVEEALDDSVFGQREASLTPIIVACARKLKRVLADEQNEILHTLRRQEPVRNLDTMLPWQTEQIGRAHVWTPLFPYTTLSRSCARKLKRVLADEQNEILHTLRRQEPVRNLDTMLPWQTE